METAGARIEAGRHRVGVLLSGGDAFYRAANTNLPELTLHAGSTRHVVLPVVGEWLGGGAPTLDYPPPANAPRAE